jgi:hypothetical protein
MFTLCELESVLPLVGASVPLTPQYAWPLLKSRTGVEIVVKHENHTPIGSFKVRGGIVYFDRLKRERPQVRGKSSPRRAAITANRWLSMEEQNGPHRRAGSRTHHLSGESRPGGAVAPSRLHGD